MCEQNCLDGVDEVYGFHNCSTFDEGDIRVVEGPIFAECTDVRIKVHGQGGHGSAPHLVKDVISAANAIYSALHSIISRNNDSRTSTVFTICNFIAGNPGANTAFPDLATMEGSIRSFDNVSKERVLDRIKKISSDIASAMECTAEVEINFYDIDCPPVINHAAQTQHVKRVANKYFGPEHMSEEGLPDMGAEDFSFFLQEKPGCYFTLGIKKPGTKTIDLHTSDYDFNDDMVATGGYFLTRLVEDRLGVKLLKD